MAGEYQLLTAMITFYTSESINFCGLKQSGQKNKLNGIFHHKTPHF